MSKTLSNAEAILKYANTLPQSELSRYQHYLHSLEFDSVTEQEDLLQLICSNFSNIVAPYGAGAIAVWFGSFVERGRDPRHTFKSVLEKFLELNCSIETVAKDSSSEAADLNHDVLSGLKLLGQALVAHIIHSKTIRTFLSNEEDVIQELERIEHLSVGAIWVLQLLRQCSGNLLVIHVTEKKGFVLFIKILPHVFICSHFYKVLFRE